MVFSRGKTKIVPFFPRHWNFTARWRITHFSLRSLVVMLLVSSVTNLIFFIYPTKIFYQQVKEKAENTLIQEKLWDAVQKLLKTCKEEKKNISYLLLEEQKNNYHKRDANSNNNLIENRKLPVITVKGNNNWDAIITVQREFFNYMAGHLRNTPYPGVENYTRYAVARLGLLPLANAEQLKPEFGPVINDVLSFRYPITVPPCRPHNVTAINNQSIFVAVISSPGNFDKRKMIRQTWKNHLKVESEKGALNVAGFGFILGLTTNNSTQNQIKEESKTYGDIIQIGMTDFYRNLSLKVAGLFNWLYRNCSKVDFLLKVDDDVYVNVRNLIHFVKSYHPSNGSMFGLPTGFLYSIRGGKWNISYEEWPWSRYPKYYFGPAVLIHGRALLPLLAAFQTTPLMPFDDVYYSGICRERAGISIRSPSSSFKVLALNQPMVPKACDLRNFIAWLTVSGNHLNNSHVATDDFYHNRTQCIVTDSNGINSTIDHNEPVQFYFH